jgi:tungstate transport system permease protein
VTGFPWGAVFEVALRTLAVCGSALIIALVLGLPLGIWLGRRRFPGRSLLVAIANTGMGLPPVVVGLGVFLLLARSGPLGPWRLIFTPEAMVVAQVVIALPLIVGITLAAVGALPADFHLQVRALGLRGSRALWVLLREIRMGLLAAVIVALGGILSEVGAVWMVGGNIEGQTRVLTTGVMMYVQMGRYEDAIALAAILMGLTFVLAGSLTAIQQTRRA